MIRFARVAYRFGRVGEALGGCTQLADFPPRFLTAELMYATYSPGDVYHMTNPTNDKTLCGLQVVPIVIDRPAKTSSLHLKSNKPTESELCKECADIERASAEMVVGR
jgi:hypothetical protein